MIEYNRLESNGGLMFIMICVCYDTGVASSCQMSNKLTLMADKAIKSRRVL